MFKDGSIVFGDLVGKLEVLNVTCETCGRAGRYVVRWLIDQHGRDHKLTDWLSTISADCPKRRAADTSDECAARCPDLSRVM